jgi:hypothetical protein
LVDTAGSFVKKDCTLMKLMRKTTLVVAAFALATLWADEAAAQAPTVTFQVSGSQVRVDWTAVPGANLYEVFVTGSLVGGPIPVPTNFFVVTAPPGTYILQVRGRNGGTIGPLSAPVTIDVGAAPPGGGGCSPVSAPTVSVATSGNVVSVSWAAVAGAIGYRLQVGASPGATLYQVDLPPGQTAFSGPVPVLGTFYVRVLAANSCGSLAPSAEQSFTLGAAAPGPTPPGGGSSGPRTANPTATNGGVLCVPGRTDLGLCIPMSTLSYANSVVNQVAAQNPFDVRNSCRAEGGNMLFMFKALSRLRQIDTRWSLNMKRGNQGESEDILAFNPTDRPDNGESQIYLFDVIGGHCGPNPIVSGLADVTLGTWNAGLANTPGCSTRFCAAWTIDAYLRAGFAP